MSDSLQKYGKGPVQNGHSRFQLDSTIPLETQEMNNSNGLDPRKLVSIIFRYKWLILVFLLAGATAAWFYAESLTPVYQSQGTLVINTTDATVNSDLSEIIMQTTGRGTNSTFASEFQVLQSRSFSREVADKLVEASPGGINEFPILWIHDEDSGNVYRAGKETVASRIRSGLDISRAKEETNVVNISFNSNSPAEAARVVNEVMQHYVESSTRQNRQAAASTAEFLRKEKQTLKQQLERSEQRLRNFMDSTGLVQVDEQASGVISERASTESELQQINLELKSTRKAIANYEEQLEKIKPGLSEQFSKAIGPRIRSMQEELAKYEREKTLIIAKNPGVQDRKPVPQRLKYVNEQIERLKKEIKQLSSQLFTEGDRFVGMDSESRADMISEIQGNLVDLKIEKNQLESRKEALEQRMENLNTNFSSLPKEKIKLAKLQRDVRMNEELYLNVSRQLADMSVLKQSQFGFGRIIDSAAIPNVPVSPNKKILLILGLMLGGFLSSLIIATREFLDDSVSSVEQLRTINLPSMTFSVVPSFDNISKRNKKSFKTGEGEIPKELVLLQDQTSLVSESFRRLKNNIIYQQGDTPPKTIAVTSPEKGDGKTTVVSNLGIAFAEEGYKTLVIDTDFRRPRLREYFGLPDKTGLSEYLEGNVSIQELLQNSDINMLKVIIAGKAIGESTNFGSNLGNNKTFEQLIQSLQEVFDVIIMDTPPFGIISDSTALLKRTESTVVVAKHRTTNKEMLYRTMEELNQIDANVTNIVLNDFDYRKETSPYYSTGYYKAYYSNYEAYVK